MSPHSEGVTSIRGVGLGRKVIVGTGTVGVEITEFVGVKVRIGVMEIVPGPAVGVFVGVRVGVFDGVPTPNVGVFVGVRVGVFDGVPTPNVGVFVGVRVGVFVGVKLAPEVTDKLSRAATAFIIPKFVFPGTIDRFPVCSIIAFN